MRSCLLWIYTGSLSEYSVPTPKSEAAMPTGECQCRRTAQRLMRRVALCPCREDLMCRDHGFCPPWIYAEQIYRLIAAKGPYYRLYTRQYEDEQTKGILQ